MINIPCKYVFNKEPKLNITTNPIPPPISINPPAPSSTLEPWNPTYRKYVDISNVNAVKITPLSECPMPKGINTSHDYTENMNSNIAEVNWKNHANWKSISENAHNKWFASFKHAKEYELAIRVWLANGEFVLVDFQNWMVCDCGHSFRFNEIGMRYDRLFVGFRFDNDDKYYLKTTIWFKDIESIDMF